MVETGTLVTVFVPEYMDGTIQLWSELRDDWPFVGELVQGDWALVISGPIEFDGSKFYEVVTRIGVGFLSKSFVTPETLENARHPE